MACVNFLRYIGRMFEVLVYVYENYWRGDACPELLQLERKLNAVGFEQDEIEDALAWLDGLNIATRGMEIVPEAVSGRCSTSLRQSPNSMRIYSVAEQDHLGAQCLGFISFLESAGVLPDHMREIAVERALAVSDCPVSLDDLKVILLMVYWSFGEEPDALVLDELCEDCSGRLAH